MGERIVIDSQCVSYLIDALINVKRPTDALASEKIALFRSYLYLKDVLYITPTAVSECGEIPNEERKALHERFNFVIFGEYIVEHPAIVDKRAKLLNSFHPGEADCRILAEAEEGKFEALLTYDKHFLRNLKRASSIVNLCKPSEFWASLNIPPGTKPGKVPHSKNPLSKERWWQA